MTQMTEERYRGKQTNRRALSRKAYKQAEERYRGEQTHKQETAIAKGSKIRESRSRSDSRKQEKRYRDDKSSQRDQCVTAPSCVGSSAGLLYVHRFLPLPLGAAALFPFAPAFPFGADFLAPAFGFGITLKKLRKEEAKNEKSGAFFVVSTPLFGISRALWSDSGAVRIQCITRAWVCVLRSLRFHRQDFQFSSDI